ncbi:aldehyde dehydrogenase family protein [Rhodococcus sp. T2V]|uniref:aldehyde dehydrogenase family protein n=1 Tax=Rhodococcus sp. T2V TaxID=3034164 RepID=UPI0023E18C9D|nr:aldehyde dehydrogenase family protein [Rhodococcus sp. T2V]MDF3311907.1 aldehyde dehydrogenase family protein [Rhodococcus sp. T2V]
MHSGVQLCNLIGGKWVPGSGAEMTSISPADPEIEVARVLTAEIGDVDRAVAAARSAQPSWRRTPPHERGAILARAAALLEASAEPWGSDLAREEGKTRLEGVAEVQRAAQILRYFAAEADRSEGDHYGSPRRGERILVTRKPLGVVGVITPFNFPIAIPAWKIAPALAYGNAVVWKPASTVPLLAFHLAQALHTAGAPAGVLNLLIGDGPVGRALAEHCGIDGVTFTGSTGVGRAIASAGAARGVPVQAEMGGKNAAVVLSDANLELAVDEILLGAFRSSGQKCTATSRLIVEDRVADDLLSQLGARADSLRVGNPLADEVQMGPVIDRAAQGAIRAGIECAVNQGARPITTVNDSPTESSSQGYFVAPTILELPSGEIDLWRDELFGPVLAVRRASSPEHAFELANDSEFGLSAAVFTQDLTRALEAIDDIDVGILHVNSETAGADPHVPFGGAKGSSYGPKEQGQSARDFFTHTTTVYLRGAKSPS